VDLSKPVLDCAADYAGADYPYLHRSGRLTLSTKAYSIDSNDS
jgi:hypothetical protein